MCAREPAGFDRRLGGWGDSELGPGLRTLRQVEWVAPPHLWVLSPLPSCPRPLPAKRQVPAASPARAPELPDTTPSIGGAHEFYGKIASLL